VLKQVIDQEEEQRQRNVHEQIRKHQERKFERCSVYIAMKCKSEFDSGSDYRRSQYCKDKYDEKILGIFFNLSKANKCARQHKQEINDEEVDSEDDEEEEEAEEDMEPYCWEDEEIGDDNSTTKVYVLQKPVDDASSLFHS
jgi:hypothetical protein